MADLRLGKASTEALDVVSGLKNNSSSKSRTLEFDWWERIVLSVEM